MVVVAHNDQETLRELNAQMRRIDLLCKLLGPLFIALLAGFSTQIAIIVNFGMNLVSVVIEYGAIARVYHIVPALQLPKRPRGLTGRASGLAGSVADDSSPRITEVTDNNLGRNWNHVKQHTKLSLLPKISIEIGKAQWVFRKP